MPVARANLSLLKVVEGGFDTVCFLKGKELCVIAKRWFGVGYE